MKKILFNTVVALVSVLIVSCNADAVDNRPVLENLVAPNMTLPTSGKSYVLKEENANTVAETFSWSSAEYSHDVVVIYTLMMDLKGSDFSNPQILATTDDVTEAAVLVKTLNQAAIDLGAQTDVATQFDVKVKCSVANALPMVTDNLISITLTPYSGLVPYPYTDWYLVGDATAAGWDNNNGNQPLFRSGSDANLYKFTGYFKAGVFKVISKLGSWAPMYGGSGGSLIYRATEADGDPTNINIATAGYYTFTMNVQNLSYTLVPFDASTATVYSTIGLIGSSRTGSEAGWNEDTDMTPSTINPHYWTLTINLFDGKAKFRANNSWDVNWGGDTAFSAFPANGTSGGDIPVAKSKYKVFFNDLDGSYLMIPNQE